MGDQMSDTHTATVETLTAEVRVLMVGTRQVTLSVAKQLDYVPADSMVPFGRVRVSGRQLELIGRHAVSGELVMAEIPPRWGKLIAAHDVPDKIRACRAIQRNERYSTPTVLYRSFTVALGDESIDWCEEERHRWQGECGGGWNASREGLEYLDLLIEETLEHDQYVDRLTKLPLVVMAGLK